MAKTVLGFDFGSFSMKIAKVCDGNVVAKAEWPLPENIIRDGSIVSYDALADEIRAAVKETQIGAAPAAVVIPAKFAVVRRIEMPLMTVDQLLLNLPYEFHDYLDMDKDKYFYDYLVNDIHEAVSEGDFDDAPKGKIMDLTAVAVPKELIRDYRQMFKDAGLKLITAVPGESAFANILAAAKVPDHKESCFIQLGYAQSRVDVYKGTTFQTSRIKETGLSVVEQLIADRENTNVHVAREHLISNFNGAQNSEEALTVYNAVASDIRKTINFYKFSNRDSELSEAYILGGGANIPAFYNVIAETAEISLIPLGALLKSNDGSDLTSYALAIGAAMQ